MSKMKSAPAGFLNRKIQNALNKINTKRAISLSIALHVMFGAAVANILVNGSTSHTQRAAEETIEFDLTTIESMTDLQFKKSGRSLQEAGVPNKNADSKSGRNSTLLKGNMNKKSLMMASLAGLEDLKGSFSFIRQKTTADSLGGFSPVNGNIPGSAYDSFGNRKGENLGRGNGTIIISGGGYCAPSPAPRPGK